MKDLLIETRGLSYRFGRQLVVDNISLAVPEGSIYGFLGPNGAGKTTTIKILMNLLRSQPDDVFLFGKSLNTNRISILSCIGSLIEQPAIYSHLSGRQNLINRAALLKVPKTRVNDILDLVDLEEAADKKAGNYSLGMKQRLGIGLALLPDPELLILDEPTNGLDPNGIIEIRNLLKKLAHEQGKTIFISSHLLSEVEKIITHAGIVNKGKLLFQGSLDDLKSKAAMVIRIRTADLAESANFLLRSGYPVEISDNAIEVAASGDSVCAEINELLVQNGHQVFYIGENYQSLEDIFISLTNS